MSNGSRYIMVYEELKKDILEGIFKVGSLLPTEQELEVRFNVSRTTIRNAVSLLKADGFVDVKQGRGTTILNPSTSQKLSVITSITESLQKNGHEVTVKEMSITKCSVPIYLSNYFNTNDELYCIERVLCSDGSPIDYATNYLLASMVPGLEAYNHRFLGLYSFVESKYGIYMTSAEETLSASTANFVESQLLNISSGTALLISRRVTYTNNQIFEYSINRIIGEKYKYVIPLSGR